MLENYVYLRLTYYIVTVLAILLVSSIARFSSPEKPAAAQRSDGLDAPLPAANMCGAGHPDDTHFTFAATGDTFPHENIQAVGEARGYDYLFDRIRPFLQAADIGYTNFDGAMLAGSPYTGYPTFNYNPALAPALKNAGIDLVSTANNHILDRGPQGLDATLGVLDQAGILQHGAVPSSTGDQPRPPYLPITLTHDDVSITIGFLSFTWGTNGIPDPYNQVNLLWESNVYGQQGNVRPSVLETIAQAQRETDLVIVAAHWGYEYQFYPDASQIEGAAQMAAAGADVILGAQPHTLQPVDILDTNGRKTLVLYSLANFIASQGAFQDPFFSATSVVFYVGIIRDAEGNVRVSGYRYLPMMMTDFDTRPAPIPRDGFAHLHAHVQRMLRDPGGIHRLSPDPPAPEERIEVCPELVLPTAPDQPISGDFAWHIATLGNTTPLAPAEMLALFGAPCGPVVTELTGDCRHTTSVLYTERQRLELHPGAEWPYRIVGTRIGTEIYKQRYGVTQVEPRQDITGDAIANERFRAFFARYGGLPVFGYPISDELIEIDATTGQPKRVQYFERARFELVADAPTDAPLLEQVQLGLLGREYAGIVAQCGTPLVRISPPSAQSAQPSAQPAAAAPAATEHLPPNAMQSGQVPTAALPATAPADPAGTTSRSGGWLLLLAFLVTLFNVGLLAVRRYRR
jgi:hypothetical protein